MKPNPKTASKKSAISAVDKANQKAWEICRDKPIKAIEIARESLKKSKEIDYEIGIAKAYHTIGAGSGWLSEFKEAEKNINKAIELLNDLRDIPELAESYYSMGVLNYYKGDLDKSRIFFGLSNENFTSVNDERGRAMSLNGLGSANTLLENYPRSWECLNEGFELAEKIKDDTIKGHIADGMATLSRKEGNFEKAIEYYELAFKLAKKAKKANAQATNLEGIGESYLHLDKYDEAEDYFNKSLEIRRKIGFKVGETECLVGLATIKLKKKEFSEAEKALQQALSMAKKAEGKTIILRALESLSTLYREQKDWEKYANTLEEYYSLKQVLSNEESLKEQNVKLEKAFENTKVLSDIGQEIISSLELDKVLFTIYNKVNQLMDASVFGIGIYHEKDKQIEYRLAIENGKKYKPYFRDVTDKSQLAVWCIDNKKYVFINDVTKEYKDYIPELVELESVDLEDGSQSQESEQSIMYIPILSGKQIIGLITVQSFDKNAYTEHHLNILKNIAIYASIALINANVYKSLEDRIQLSKEIESQHAELEKAYENNKTLSEIGKEITSSLSIPEVINKVYKNINNLMDASVFLIGIYNEKENIIDFEGAIEKGEEVPFFTNDIKDTSRPAVICFTQKKEIIINDRIKDYTKVLGQVPAPKVGDAPESIIYLPLTSKDKTIGVISVQSFNKNAYLDYHIDILKNLAVYIPIALENALLYKEVEEKVNERTKEIEQSYKNTKILSEIGVDIVSARSVESITETVYAKVNSLMDASSIAIGIFNEKENRLDFPCDMEKGEKLAFNFDSLDDKVRMSVFCFKNQKEVLINDLEKEYNKYVKTAKAPGPSIGEQPESLIYVPLSLLDKHIGVFTVQSFEKNAYTSYHLDIVRNLATSITTAIENALLYESLEDQVKERTAEVTEQKNELERTYQNTMILNEIGQEITSSLSIKEVIRKVYKSINNIMDAAVFSIALYNPKKKVLVFEGGMEKDEELPYYELDMNDEDRLAVNCFKNKREIIIHTRKDIKKYVKSILAPAVGELPESTIYLPLISKDKTLGVFTVQSFKKNAYSNYHINLLRNLAVYAPVALENAMMYGKMEDEVARRTEEIERSYKNTKTLSEIGQEINSSLSIDEVTQKVYKSLNTVLDATVFNVGIHNESKNVLEFRGGMEKGELLPYHKLEMDDDDRPAIQCFKSKKEFIINDWEEYIKSKGGKYIPPAAGEIVESLIYYPLIIKDKVLGVITVQSFKKNTYENYHLDIVRNLATPISNAIENALIYQSLEEKVTERTNELVKEKEKADFEKEEAKYQRRRAEQSERFKQQFLANMSHEIRTPMNAIMGMTNLLLEKNPKEEHISYLNTIKLSSESLLVIINDILDLSKIEAGKMELEQTDFSLEEVVGLVERTLTHRAEEKGLILSLSYDDQIPKYLTGDSVRLQQVLMNIAGNAIKFTEKGGVSISVNLEGGIILGDQAKIRFEIRDTGIGMTREQQNKVFENFSQATSDTTRKYGGTGLGLSISSKLIELFGSSIKLESELNHGSTFHFVINFKVSDNQEVQKKDVDIAKDMIGELKGLRILLAEDNEYNRIVATETLELKIPGVSIECAFNGEEAVKMAEEKVGELDIVLMDVQMPIMDGFDATRNIRKNTNKTISNLPIVALTASVIKTDIQKCFDAGMNGYIPKPFKTSELIEAIYKAVKKEISSANESAYIQENKVNSSKAQKITHLSYLNDFTEGDTDRIKKYVEMYLDSARANRPKLDTLMQKEDLDGLKSLVHSLKPHFDFMGMTATRELSEGIERIIANREDLNALPEKVEELLRQMAQSIDELNEKISVS